MDAFAKRLRQLRMDAGEKQTDLQTHLHCSQGMVSAYENGREPSYDTLVQIARHYDVSTDYLLGLTGIRHPDHSADQLTVMLGSCISAAEEKGLETLEAERLLTLLDQLHQYLSGSMEAGDLPSRVIAGFITGMASLLTALNRSQTCGVIDATNQLLASVLDVNNITMTYLTREKEIAP